MEKIYEKISELCALLNRSKKTFATAESCTGGFISKAVTDIAGVSSVFVGGVVSYSNDVKEKLLYVKHETLESYGAVSHQTALEMSSGALAATGADYAVAVTGIAGPGGGSDEKPVGTVYISCAGKNKEAEARKYHFSGDRSYIRYKTTKEALSFLIDYIGDIK